ncbi:MAG: hypothetical protein JSU70_14275 [Phycisphaerales bacterium]|nr:MAG: hypothetical protein JSU70_14275 [Phycisphaerales bacterium]
MGKTYASVEIHVPVSKCYSYVRNSLKDPKFVTAYRTLHNGRDYSGRVVSETQNRQLVIEERAIDSMLAFRHKGWSIKYDFQETGRGTTRVAVSVEYGALLAFMAMTTAKLQSVNEVLTRINSLIALECGVEPGDREQMESGDG